MKYSSREDMIALAIFGVIGLIVPGVVVLQHFIGIDPLSVLHITWGGTFFGVAFTVLATLVCLWNCYVSIIVPWDYQRRHGSMAGFAHTSGLPWLGGVFILFAGALMPPSVLLGVFLLLLYVVDGNGIPWFFISFVRGDV